MSDNKEWHSAAGLRTAELLRSNVGIFHFSPTHQHRIVCQVKKPFTKAKLKNKLTLSKGALTELVNICTKTEERNFILNFYK